jgi:hypothetical protein
MKKVLWAFLMMGLILFGLSDISGIHAQEVIHGPAVSIAISPKTATLTTDEVQQFTVTAKDANQVSWDATHDVDFFIQQFAGIINRDGQFDSQKVGGPYTIRAVAYGYADDAMVTITPGKRATLAIVPPIASLKSGTTFVFALVTRDADGNVLGPDGVVWSSDLTSVGTIDDKGVFTAKQLGNTYVRATGDGLEASALAMVSTPTSATQLVVTPEKITMPADETVELRASYEDEFGNTTDVTAQTQWKITDPIGRVEGNIYSPGSVGEWQVTGTANGLSDTVAVTITHGAAVTLVMSPTTVEIASDQKQTFSLVATDRDGNSWDAASDVLLTTTDPLGAFSGNIYHPGTVGVWDITATVDEAVAAATVTVTSGGAKQLQIQPQPLQVNIGESLTVLVKGFDQDQNMIDVTDRATINVSGGGTMIGNQFTASEAGSFTLTAEYNGLSESSSLTVSDPGEIGVPSTPPTNEPASTPEPSAPEDSTQETPSQTPPTETPPTSTPPEVTPPEGTVRGEETEPEVFRSEPLVPEEPTPPASIGEVGEVKGVETLSVWWYGVLAGLLVLLGFIGWKLVQKTNTANR